MIRDLATYRRQNLHNRVNQNRPKSERRSAGRPPRRNLNKSNDGLEAGFIEETDSSQGSQGDTRQVGSPTSTPLPDRYGSP